MFFICLLLPFAVSVRAVGNFACYVQGIAEMTGQNEGSKYEFLEVSNPDSLLIKGEDEKVILDDCKELARIQSL